MHIELLQMPRASGKTTLLIKESAKTGRPIIEPNTASARYVEEQARAMGLKIPEPISATSWNGGYYRGGNFNRIDGFLIDEVDSVLANIFGRPICKVTYTPEKIDDLYLKMNGLKSTELKNVLKEMKRLNAKPIIFTTSTKEEKKMSKFKVGDIVRVKPVDEMWKSDLMAKSLEKYACTQHRVNTIHIICGRTLYVLDDCDNGYFDESMLEDRVYTEDDIIDINIIVPDKVVEIEFYDGKEKMVCHNDDTFDIRKCCFIAIAKHLYKKEYTQEGIEYMATQLTYQKKYVKIVDKSLKDYKKKENEKAKKARMEEEERIIRERQSLKRRKQKERRAQRHREALIDVFADSINEAKKRRKANK